MATAPTELESLAVRNRAGLSVFARRRFGMAMSSNHLKSPRALKHSELWIIINISMREKDYRAAMLLECLGEPNRFQILRHLERGPMSVSVLARATKRHQTTVCHHLAVLRTMHLVRYHNRGVNTFYQLKHPEVLRLLRAATEMAPKLSALDEGVGSSPS